MRSFLVACWITEVLFIMRYEKVPAPLRLRLVQMFYVRLQDNGVVDIVLWPVEGRDVVYGALYRMQLYIISHLCRRSLNP